MAGGRPTDYKPEYCQMMVDMLRTGLGLSSFADSIDVCHDTLNEWAKVHPEFSAAKKRAKCGKTANWEKKTLLPKDHPERPSDTTIIFMLKNSCPEEYSDRAHEPKKDEEQKCVLSNASSETLTQLAKELSK